MNAGPAGCVRKWGVRRWSAKARAVASVAIIQEERLTGSSLCRISGHASCTCVNVTGPVGTTGAAAAEGDASGVGRFGSLAALVRSTTG